VNSIIFWEFVKGSKRKFPALWEHAGQPTLFEDAHLFSAIPLVKYIWRRDYAEINDHKAISYADKLRRPAVSSYIAAVFFLSTLFISVFILVTLPLIAPWLERYGNM
jgi:hypothetical protein